MSGRRVEVLIDEDRYRRLVAYAKERNLSVSAVVREAIDSLPTSESAREAAARTILSAEPMPVPDPAGLRKELEEPRAGRR